jgi:hypothetical protein
MGDCFNQHSALIYLPPAKNSRGTASQRTLLDDNNFKIKKVGISVPTFEFI